MALVRLEPRRRLTASQELIWTSQRIHPDVPLANMANLSTIDGDLDPERFVAAVDHVVRKADALRTHVRDVDGVPHPAIHAEPPSTTSVIEVPWSDMHQWCAARIAAPIDISTTVYDSVLIQHPDTEGDDVAPGRWSWWFDCHHVATDAASSATIFQAVAAAYHGEWEPSDSYEALAARLDDAADTPRWLAAADHWRTNAPAPTQTSFYTPDAGPTTAAERIEVSLVDRQGRLDDLLAERFRLISPDLSLTVALGTVLAAYLHRLGNDRIVIGVPVHHRVRPEDKSVIGPLVELFPVEIAVEPADSFADIHRRWGRALFDTLRHAQPGTSPPQTFDVVLNVHAATFGAFGDLPTTTHWVHPGHIDAHHRLRMQALDYDGSGRLRLAIDVNHRIAGPDHRRRAGEHLGLVIDAMLDDPDRAVGTVGLRTEGEATLLAEQERPGPGTPLESPAPTVIARRLRDHADRVVMRHRHADGVSEWTGRSLDEQIDSARIALTARGIGVGDRVGVEMGVGADAVIAIHAILRAGAAFVPIDPAYPDERRAHIREDAGCQLVLRSLDELRLDDHAPSDPAPQIEGDSLAYMIYTSGSTGLPKGVPITHDGLAEYLGFAYTAYVGAHAPIMPLFTSLSFDLTITTLFLPFLSGGQMTLHPEGGLPALRQIVDERRATMLKATPSHLELLVRMIDDRHPLDTLIVGGEAFLIDLADRLEATCRPGLQIHNEYGPTEAVVGCMDHRYDATADPGPEVPIGHAAPGVGLHILDGGGLPVPLGVAGELHLTRRGLTAGYHQRPDLNAERFVEIGGVRAYRTGDLVRMLDADRMVYLGRIDEQVKVGGIRLEPAEIEHAALDVDGVARCVAGLWTPDPTRPVARCVRCGLGDDVPEIVVDGDGICSACHAHDLVAPQAAAWFRTEDDLRAELADARRRSAGDYDVLHLLSGGKDSTYALYALVELGARVRSITLDNGFISDIAKDNVRRATTALGVDHEFVTVDAMNDIFRDSLDRFSNVCQGCYKTIYTLALATADELGIPAIVTGLSRGQFFETRLVPGLFDAERFDPERIDDTVTEARRVYHRTPDAVSEHFDTTFITDAAADGTDIFDRVTFIDFYRYVDVPLAEMYETLERTQTWRRPPDTGRSTNCLINSAGIHVHKLEQGHHNYALPYSWDVRLGHKTRDEALHELDDPMGPEELAEIATMLAEVGYEPRPAEVLTLWVEPLPGVDPVRLEDELRQRLRQALPAHAVPTAIEFVDDVPLSPNGKVDASRLPAPSMREQGANVGTGRSPESDTEQMLAASWSRVLGRPINTVSDDFFAIGGTSLHALEMIVEVSERCGVMIPESLAFTASTIESLAIEIDRRIADADGGDEAAHQLPPERDDSPPLSPGERAMLYEWRRDPSDRRYNVARLHRLDRPIDLDRFDDAVRAVVAHQPALHRSFSTTRRNLGGAAVRIARVHADHATIDGLADAINRESFDLVNGPLVTVHHLTSGVDGDGRPAILLRAHHGVVDAGSLDVFWNQIDTVYRGEPLPALQTTTSAHGEWQRTRLPDPAEVWNPDADRPPASLIVRGRHIEPDGYVHQLSSVSMSDLRAAPGTTPFATALTALVTVLDRRTTSGPLEISVTSSVRDHPDLAPVVGYFLNPLPILIEKPAEEGWTSLAGRVSSALVDALQHRSAPFADLIRSARDRGIPEPKGSIMLAVEDLAPTSLGGVRADHRILASGIAVNDCTFFVQIRGERIELGVEYRGAVLGRAEARSMLQAFDAAIMSLCGSSPSSAGFTPTDSVLVGEPLDRSAPMAPIAIDRAVEQYPDASAVVSGTQQLSYRELDIAARALAARLRERGVAAGDRVGVVLERSVHLPVAIRAIWTLGASYVPLDVSLPATRVTELLIAADVSVAVTAGEMHPGLQEVLTVRADAENAPVLPLQRTHPTVADDEAYVIFTSGSTGTPKGVPISHGNLAASLAARQSFYRDRVETYLLVSSAGFDSSVAGLFWTLADGGTLVIPTESEVHDVDALLARIAEHRVSHTLCVPSLYGALLARDSGELDSMHTVIVAGEACPADVAMRHLTRHGEVALVNEYGPTEATVWASAHVVGSADLESLVGIPIGRPIPGSTLIVVDEGGRPVPLGVPGELVVAGPGVAAGYLARASDAGFDTDPASPEADDRSPFVETAWGLSYRTGDRVIGRPDGTVDFLGRVDDQLSIGGVRIEPAEIEQVLMGIEGVRAAAVADRHGALVGLVETDLDDLDEVRRRAGERLPSTHVPGQLERVDELPRTRNGKIDRAQVAVLVTAVSPSTELAEAPATDGHVGPVDPNLVAMTDVWSEVFGVSVGPDDDFFDLGGDSLVAVELVTRLETAFGRRVGIGELIDAPTPRKVAPLVELEQSSPVDSGDDASDRLDPLVEWLRRDGRRAPVVLLPPGGGNLLRYEHLVRALDPAIPVVGIRLPGADANSDVRDTIEEQASVMLAALDTATPTPTGGHVLLGWSTGGLLAWEIAQQLLARGDDVAAIVLVDTVMGGMHVDAPETPVAKYRRLLRTEGAAPLVAEAGNRARERAEFALARRRYRRTRAEGATPDPVDAERRLGPVIRSASLAYRPQALGVPMLYVSASESDDALTTNPWRALQETANCPFELLLVDGVHFEPVERGVLGAAKAHEVGAAVYQLMRSARPE